MPRYKSAETGKFVSAKYAAIHPDTTYMVPSKKRKKTSVPVEIQPIAPIKKQSFWEKLKDFFTRG